MISSNFFDELVGFFSRAADFLGAGIADVISSELKGRMKSVFSYPSRLSFGAQFVSST